MTLRKLSNKLLDNLGPRLGEGSHVVQDGARQVLHPEELGTKGNHGPRHGGRLWREVAAATTFDRRPRLMTQIDETDRVGAGIPLAPQARYSGDDRGPRPQ